MSNENVSLILPGNPTTVRNALEAKVAMRGPPSTLRRPMYMLMPGTALPLIICVGLPCAAKFAGEQIVDCSCAVNSGSLQGMNEFKKKSPLGAICAADVLRENMTSP